ncbi:MAG: hypothetical protein U0S48_18615 [Solirubrobacteraceae bacterium]
MFDLPARPQSIREQRVALRLTPAERAYLEALAAREGETLSNALRRLVAAGLAADATRKGWPPLPDESTRAHAA